MTVETGDQAANSKTDEASQALDDEATPKDEGDKKGEKDDKEDDDHSPGEESVRKVTFSERDTGSASIEDGEILKPRDELQDSIRQSIENSLRRVEGKVVAGFVVLSRPVQRQRWGDTQLHPHVEWGSLFFDLFFVAMAYNLANIIRQDPSTTALLYFAGCFFPVASIWFDKLVYDARFFTRDDVLHRFFEVLVLVTLGSAVLNIRPVDILSTPSENPEIFAFCFTVLLGNVLTVLRYLEVFIWVEGEPAAKRSALRDMGFKILPVAFYLTATIYSGLEFFGARSDDRVYDDGHRLLAESAVNSTYDCSDDAHRRWLAGEESSSVDPCACVDGDEGHRWLAAATDCPMDSSSYGESSSYGSYGTDSTNIPIILMLSGIGASYALTVLWMFILPGGGNHKQYTVPMNVDFTIHRYGEWTMLMLGESILSLLIVEVSRSNDYYVTFYAGILSVVLLQYMHFRSQPHNADDHAMRKSKERGLTYAYLMLSYSAALVLLGATYKMLLYEFVYSQSYDDDGHRSLLFGHIPRWLAGGDGALKYDLSDRRERIANFFSGSMAVVFFCCDALILTHRDFKTNLGRCRCNKTKKTKLLGLLLLLMRVGLIAFVATLSQYMTDPKVLSLTGLGAIFCQVLLRFASAVVFPSDQVHVELEEKKEEMEAKERAEREEKERHDEYYSGEVVANRDECEDECEDEA